MRTILSPKNLQESMMEDQLWGMIRRAAIHDEGLRDLLNEVKVYFKLKYDNQYHGRIDKKK